MKRARVIELINKFDDDLEHNPTRCQFKIAFEDDDSGSEDIMSSNDILDYVEREHNNEDGHEWGFRKILSNTVTSGKKGKEDRTEVHVQWETGATSTETLVALKKDTPVDLAIYAKEINLLVEEGWKTLQYLATRSKLTERLVHQARLQSFRVSPKYKIRS